MSAALRLMREGIEVELRRGTFAIEVDGVNLGSIESHETVEKPLEPGHHVLRIQAGRYSSESRAFDMADGDVASFRCHGAMMWPRYVASMMHPELAISLKRE